LRSVTADGAARREDEEGEEKGEEKISANERRARARDAPTSEARRRPRRLAGAWENRTNGDKLYSLSKKIL
jgi:hypothetical protein